MRRYPPSWIFPNHFQDQRVNGLIGGRPSLGRPPFRSVELPRDELSVPGKNGFGTDNLRDFLQGFTSETFPNFSEADAIRIVEA